MIKLGALGDFIFSLGAMKAIRERHPGAHITLLTSKPFVDIAERSRYFNEILPAGRPRFYEVDQWINIFRRLNKGQFTRVYDLQMNDRTSLFYRLFIKKPEWVGAIKSASHYAAKQEWHGMHAFKRLQLMFQELGMEIKTPDVSWMTSDVSLFKIKRPYVLLVPGSAPAHPEKRWPALKYGALGLQLIRQGYNVVVLGTHADEEAVDRVIKSCPEAKSLCGQTSLYDIATLARDAAGAVGNDTGPSHLISIAGCPLVSLFSSASDPKLSAPIGPSVTIIQSDSLVDVAVDDVLKNLHLKAAA